MLNYNFFSAPETAVAFTIFKKARFDVQFATETGKPPKCDDRMLYGVTGKILVGMPPTTATKQIYRGKKIQGLRKLMLSSHPL